MKRISINEKDATMLYVLVREVTSLSYEQQCKLVGSLGVEHLLKLEPKLEHFVKGKCMGLPYDEERGYYDPEYYDPEDPC